METIKTGERGMSKTTKGSGERETRPVQERNTPKATAEDDGGRLVQMYRMAMRDLERHSEWKQWRMSFVKRAKKKCMEVRRLSGFFSVGLDGEQPFCHKPSSPSFRPLLSQSHRQ